jgi:flagellin-specific chaperone FliS
MNIKLRQETLRLHRKTLMLEYKEETDREKCRAIARQIADLDQYEYETIIEPEMLKRGHTVEDIYKAMRQIASEGTINVYRSIMEKECVPDGGEDAA